MKTFSLAFLMIGLALIITGVLLVLFPPVMSYIVAAVSIIGGISCLVIFIRRRIKNI